MAAIVPSTSGRPARAVLLFPDLDQRAPAAVTLRAVTVGGAKHLRLGFASNVENVGRGPLVVEGRRQATTAPGMRATQYVRIQHAAWRAVAHAGTIRFNVAHSHWHLLPFETYELRRPNGTRLGLAHKTGFCLVSDHRVPRPPPATPRQSPFTGNCGRHNRGLLSVIEGISVGYGDVYPPYLEGQSIDVTRLPSGRYVLVHRVNAARRLRELDYRNDGASALLELTTAPTPAVVVVKTCDDSVICRAP